MKYLVVFVLTFLIWKLTTWNMELSNVIAGVVVCAVVTAIFGKEFPFHRKKTFELRRYLYFIRYLAVFVQQVVKANFIMAYRILSPGPPIRPGVVTIPISLKSSLGRIILANSITLAPGTFTMDIHENSLDVHCIYVATEHPEEAAELICGRLQRILKEVFE